MIDKKTEVDVAFEILKAHQEPMYYMDLIREIGKRYQKEYTIDAINSIYTALNLDNRLEHHGEGYWFLTNYRGSLGSKKEK